MRNNVTKTRSARSGLKGASAMSLHGTVTNPSKREDIDETAWMRGKPALERPGSAIHGARRATTPSKIARDPTQKRGHLSLAADTAEGGGRKVEGGERRAEGGERRVEGGERRVEGGERRAD
ncbi:unnamed protein product [Closterium sp. NIES-53]